MTLAEEGGIHLHSRLKFLDADGLSPVYGYDWPKPESGKPGEWAVCEEERPIEASRYGLHTCFAYQARTWVSAQCYTVEVGDEGIETEYASGGGVCVHRRARLLERVAAWTPQALRLWAADCAERSQHLINTPLSHVVLVASRLRALDLMDDTQQRRYITMLYDESMKNMSLLGSATAASGALWRLWPEHGCVAAADAACQALENVMREHAERTKRFLTVEEMNVYNVERAWQNTRLIEYLRGDVDLDAIRLCASNAWEALRLRGDVP